MENENTIKKPFATVKEAAKITAYQNIKLDFG